MEVMLRQLKVVQQQHFSLSLEAKASSIGELKDKNTRLNTMSSAGKDVFLNKTNGLRSFWDC